MSDYDDDLDLELDEFGESEDELEAIVSKKTQHTNRRRELEDKLDLWRLKDELGIYDDALYS